MSPRRIGVLAGHELRMLRDDVFAPVILLVMPLIVMSLVKPMFGLALRQQGVPAGNGAAGAVPGEALMFGMFVVMFGGFAFYRDHQWFVWERLRTTRLTPAELVVGKSLPILAMSAGQLAALFALSVPLFGLRVAPGDVPALAAAVAATAAMITSIAVALAAVCRSVQRFSSIGNLVSLAVAGAGGGLVPTSLLPGWAQAVAPATPAYWSIKAFREIFLGRVGWTSVWLPVAVLAGIAAVLTALAVLRFDAAETKVSWS